MDDRVDENPGPVCLGVPVTALSLSFSTHTCRPTLHTNTTNTTDDLASDSTSARLLLPAHHSDTFASALTQQHWTPPRTWRPKRCATWGCRSAGPETARRLTPGCASACDRQPQVHEQQEHERSRTQTTVAAALKSRVRILHAERSQRAPQTRGSEHLRSANQLPILAVSLHPLDDEAHRVILEGVIRRHKVEPVRLDLRSAQRFRSQRSGRRTPEALPRLCKCKAPSFSRSKLRRSSLSLLLRSEAGGGSHLLCKRRHQPFLIEVKSRRRFGPDRTPIPQQAEFGQVRGRAAVSGAVLERLKAENTAWKRYVSTGHRL